MEFIELTIGDMTMLTGVPIGVAGVCHLTVVEFQPAMVLQFTVGILRTGKPLKATTVVLLDFSGKVQVMKLALQPLSAQKAPSGEIQPASQLSASGFTGPEGCSDMADSR